VRELSVNSLAPVFVAAFFVTVAAFAAGYALAMFQFTFTPWDCVAWR
jgi:hypothetical protein